MKIDCSKTENFLREWKRMCEMYGSWCGACIFNKGAFSCRENVLSDSKRTLELIQIWSDEHPTRTILDELLEHYPKFTLSERNALPIGGDNYVICPSVFGYKNLPDCRESNNCVKCWNQPVPEVEKCLKMMRI